MFGVTGYGIEKLLYVFQCPLKGPQSYNMYKNPLLGFLQIFKKVFIDAPEKLPKFGAFSTLGTALVLDLRLVAPLVGQSRGLPPYALLVERPFPPGPWSWAVSLETR